MKTLARLRCLVNGNNDPIYELTEGTLFDSRPGSQRVLVSSIPTCGVHVISPQMIYRRYIDVRALLAQQHHGHHPGADRFLCATALSSADGGYHVLLGNAIARLKIGETADDDEIFGLKPIHSFANLRCNDWLILDDGTAVVTGLSQDAPMAEKGFMLHIGLDGTAKWVTGKVGLGNGLIQKQRIDDDRVELLWHDSHSNFVQIAVLNTKTATLESNQPWHQVCDGRVFVGGGDQMALPDAIDEARDSQGNRYAVVTEWGCGRASLINMETREVAGHILMPDGITRPTYIAIAPRIFCNGPSQVVAASETTGDGPVNCGIFVGEINDFHGAEPNLCWISL